MLAPGRPLTVWHPVPELSLAAVSIAWLRTVGSRERARLEARQLSAAEIDHTRALRFRRRRDEWLAGRLAVKHCVGAHQRRRGSSATPPDRVHIGTVSGGVRAGKPVVDAPVEVNLSHSGDFAVAACGSHAVGIDLEHRRDMPPSLSRVLMEDMERDEERSPGRERLLTMPPSLRWACKEAVLKHYGFGLRVDVRDVRLVTWEPDGRFTWSAGPGLLRLAPAADARPPTSWADTVDGYAMALVWQAPGREWGTQ
ncbi:hypothetical protein N566_16975 [Streptomycetaceae bacterium MP113-05]|nr:hypothetical protein N566_16975 [Streptomycetaceae bacterium MP113-05]